MPVITNLLQVVTTYHLLLERYARRLTGDAAAAPAIAKMALEHYWDNRQQIPHGQIRQHLKRHTMQLCRFWHIHNSQSQPSPQP